MYDTLRFNKFIAVLVAVFAALALAIVFAAPVLARGGGGRGGGGGGFRGGGGGGFGGGGFSRPSPGFSRPSTPSFSPPTPSFRPPTPSPGFRPGGPGTGPGPVNPNRPDNRPWHTGNNNINTGNVNVNTNNGGWGWGWGSGAGLALGAAAATGAAIGSATSDDGYYDSGYAPTVIYSLPPSCSAVVVNGTTYQNCGDAYYVPTYSGSSIVYQAVPAPY